MANKVRKNWPQINKNRPSSLFSSIIQAAADPNHPTQFHLHLGLLPALLNIQRHCPSGNGGALEPCKSICSSWSRRLVGRDDKPQLSIGRVSQTPSSATGGNHSLFCPRLPQLCTQRMTTLTPGRSPGMEGFPIHPSLRYFQFCLR